MKPKPTIQSVLLLAGVLFIVFTTQAYLRNHPQWQRRWDAFCETVWCSDPPNETEFIHCLQTCQGAWAIISGSGSTQLEELQEDQ